MRFDTEDVLDLLERTGHEPRRYSGRGMDGRECVGVSCDNPFQVIGDMIAENNDSIFVEAFGALIASSRTDSMGRRQIIYWPTLEWTDEDEDEDET